MKTNNARRSFITSVSMLAVGTALSPTAFGFGMGDKKLKVALIGTGVRGTSFWGRRLVETYSDILEFVGICDINPGRLAYAKKYMKVSCKTYSDFEKMVIENSPDLVIVTTTDATHHEFIGQRIRDGLRCFDRKTVDNG